MHYSAVKELKATPGEDVQSLYLTNWATEAHLLISGSMSAYGIEANESDVAANPPRRLQSAETS